MDAAVVRITAAVFALYGIAFLLAPERAAWLVTEAVPGSASAVIDVRATYGGMSVAVGALLFALAADPGLVRKGLLGVILLMAGMAAGRICGIALDGPANRVMWAYLVLEIAVAAVASWRLWAARRSA